MPPGCGNSCILVNYYRPPSRNLIDIEGYNKQDLTHEILGKQ